MYCPKCGALNADSAPICTQCGENLQQSNTNNRPDANSNPVVPGQVVAPKPENYLIWSILATLFCCLPLGIVSIVFATQVDSKYYAGDVPGAVDASNKAKTWAIASAVIGGLAIIIWFILAVIGAAARS